MSTETLTKPCTSLTARCADARDYRRELRECCRAHIRGLMVVVQEFLDRNKVVWWADYGTLMGAVCNPLTTWADYPWLPQEGRPPGPLAPGIIPHDKDADIGVMMTPGWDICRLRLEEHLRRNHYHLYRNVHRHSMKARVSRKNQTNVDLFFWREAGPREAKRFKPGTLFRDKYAVVDKYKGREFHKDMLFPLSTVPWEGLTLPAPRDPEAFLAFRYGPDWRTPVMANNKGVLRK